MEKLNQTITFLSKKLDGYSLPGEEIVAMQTALDIDHLLMARDLIRHYKEEVPGSKYFDKALAEASPESKERVITGIKKQEPQDEAWEKLEQEFQEFYNECADYDNTEFGRNEWVKADPREVFAWFVSKYNLDSKPQHLTPSTHSEVGEMDHADLRNEACKAYPSMPHMSAVEMLEVVQLRKAYIKGFERRHILSVVQTPTKPVMTAQELADFIAGEDWISTYHVGTPNEHTEKCIPEFHYIDIAKAILTKLNQ